jgi:hypothetical protein
LQGMAINTFELEYPVTSTLNTTDSS